MKKAFKAKVAAVVVMGLLVGVQANAADKGKYEIEFIQKCHDNNGVYSAEGNGIVQTCRSLNKAELVGVYFPEQSYFLNGGDPALFEKSFKEWGKR